MKRLFLSVIVSSASLLSWQREQPSVRQVSGSNCSFTSNPDEFLLRELRVRKELAGRVKQLDSVARRTSAALPLTLPAAGIPQRNFIDNIIFNKLTAARVPSAALSTDEEFLRRITLDLTGRIPSSSDIRAFAADSSPAKRDLLIEQLLNSQEFVDKWTMWDGRPAGQRRPGW